MPNFRQSLQWADDAIKDEMHAKFGHVLLDFGGFLLSLPEVVKSNRKIDTNINAIVYLLTQIWDLDEEKFNIFLDKAEPMCAGSQIIWIG